jgi:Fur family transcriptional regulator, iron response regulator
MDVVTQLETRGIQPSAQRVAVAEFVLHTDRHPTADEVLAGVRAKFPRISRATVYNTLNLFVAKRLLRSFTVDGRVVFDPMMGPHHHFVDSSNGQVYDLPWETFRVESSAGLSQFEVAELQVVARGRYRGPARRR